MFIFPLFFFGDRCDHRIAVGFRTAAQSRYGCAVFSQEEIHWDKQAQYLLVEQEAPEALCCGAGAVILKNRLTTVPPIFPCDAVCIVPSQNPQAVEWAMQSSRSTIACGTSPYDTLTFSSLTAEKAVLSLQRQLILPGSHLAIEPAEFPISFTGRRDLYTILAIAAIFLVSGEAEALSGLCL